ncbi:hypothetical protein [Streptomyces sp. R44]|uniref:Uncharacterized protein n=1 Tax=Streptomyces sp. R44 TaxID=3238633 RepID=A0AB39T926_9ACTN
MRSARILLAATAAAGTLAIAAPGAYAGSTGDWDKDDYSHSQERDHDKPKGGMHTGAGALSSVSGDDWSKGDHEKSQGDHEKSKEDHEKSKEDHEKWQGDHEKPKGGMHTGSGALSLVNADDWSKEKEKDKDTEKGKDWDKDKDKGKEDGYKPEKPKGGMHTGGGGLAGGTNVTGALVVAGGIAAFALHRRRKAANAA